jgi:geranylgeranyl diphosphate synthase type I
VPNHTLAIDPGPLAEIDAGLAGFLETELLALGEVDPALVGFADVIRDLTLGGGKRIRPTFAYWGFRGACGDPAELAAALPALAALELLHTFALIHDDVMDRSALRRGRPTAHERYAGEHAGNGWRGPADHFGTSAAILAGDLCLVWADRLIAEADLPAARLAAARRVYDAMRVDAVAGQYLDVLGEAAPGEWTGRRALAVARYKTASYTVRRPLEFGAALAGVRSPVQPARAGRKATLVRTVASNSTGPARERRTTPAIGVPEAAAAARASLLAAYARYGDAVGEAFQLRDDLLGVYGDPTVTGKPAGDDLRRGKPTSLVLIALRRADPGTRAALERLIGDPDADPGDAAELISRTGARHHVENMIDARLRRAVRTITAAPVDPEVRDTLVRLAEVATSRQA